MYPGMTFIGTGKFAGLYGLNETIVDQKATGLQHFFIGDYRKDLIHTACSVAIIDDKAYFGDRIKPKVGHPDRVRLKSSVEGHGVFVDTLTQDRFLKTDRVGTLRDDMLYFETEIINQSEETMDVKVASLVITQRNAEFKIKKARGAIMFECEGKHFAMMAQEGMTYHASLDAPSGFMYHGIEDLLYAKNEFDTSLASETPISVSIESRVSIKAHDAYLFRWMLVVGDHEEELRVKLAALSFDHAIERIKSYWQTWLNRSTVQSRFPEVSDTMLVALKAATLNGFLPADLTGHYFANGKACFYVRDALMGARAFLYSGHREEFLQVVRTLLDCPRKENGEFYQRYNPDLLPDEGANNNVFSQIDAIGYFARVVSDDFSMHHERIVDFAYLRSVVDGLNHVAQKNGLYGPEGGVNEGVFGPAFITSTNMFIAGGLFGAAELATSLGKEDEAKRWKTMAERLVESIESCFLEEGYYAYGYVEYHDEILRKYDTPQFFAASLGYPLTENYEKNYKVLDRAASFFQDGIGYSEQEYHHGPWLFNTAASAQVARSLGDVEGYERKVKWMADHRNEYGLLPEAIDATDERRCFINPLMWASAECVCACYVDEIMKLRR